MKAAFARRCPPDLRAVDFLAADFFAAAPPRAAVFFVADFLAVADFFAADFLEAAFLAVAIGTLLMSDRSAGRRSGPCMRRATNYSGLRVAQ
jgi:hypothetical protein